jgi:hypothetical protein
LLGDQRRRQQKVLEEEEIVVCSMTSELRERKLTRKRSSQCYLKMKLVSLSHVAIGLGLWLHDFGWRAAGPQQQLGAYDAS